GMVVHPAAGNADKTLVNALLYHCAGSLSGIGGEIRPGIVHRIDKDTSGLLVVAKDDATHRGLSAQFAKHSIVRVYHAVAYGGFSADSGTIDASIGRSTADRKKMAVTATHARHAVTLYRVVARYDGFTHLSLTLQTGRTHQIRVHLSSIGHPLAGDAVYGPRKAIASLHGQCLHAKTLGFVHPATGKEMLFDSELPEYFTAFLARL
ncbi:MAG: RluA family pseudouridine synthase, partial [Oscillospiraceae bacterium]